MTSVDEQLLPPIAVAIRRPLWWVEVPILVGFYLVYAQIRDWHGAATEHARSLARQHGYEVLDVERWLHIDIEKGAQALFLHARPVVVGMNVFYGTAHFVVTLAVFGWLLVRGAPAAYRHARNILMLATTIGLVVFALYPTMPPRLMPARIRTIDTMDAVGSLWSYNHGVLEHITDPFAAMPSLHIVWASWVAYVIWLQVEHRRLRWLAWAYPVLTGLVVVVTGTHWVLDLAGGAAVFALATYAVRRFSVGRPAGRTRPDSSSR